MHAIAIRNFSVENGPAQMASSHRGEQRRAFTLVELLVVIGITALLISILLPAMALARQQAQSIACASNLRTLGQAVFMYAGDYRGQFPPMYIVTDNVHYPDGGVYGLLESYGIPKTSAVRTCPAVMSVRPDPGGTVTFSYRYNQVIGGMIAVNGFPGPTPDPSLGGSFIDARPLKITDVPGANAPYIGMFCDFDQWLVEEAGSTFASYRWTVNTVGAPANVKLITFNGTSHQSIHDFTFVHFPKVNGAGLLTGMNNVVYCDGSVRSELLLGSSTNGIYWPDTGLVPTVAP